MPSRTGTASLIDASGGNGSTSVDVPANCNAVVAFWSHWNFDSGSTLSGLTLDGDSFLPAEAELAEGATPGVSGVGVAVLLNPSTGTQTLAWTWSGGGARAEGGGIVLVYIQDANTTDPVRDAAVDGATSNINVSVTIDTESDDLVLGFAGSFNFQGSDPARPDISLTEFIDNALINSHMFDVGEDAAPSSPSTTVDMTGEHYSWIAAISLKAAGGETELAPADASHAQFADNVALTQANLLVVQDASHDHASDSIVLTVARVLDVADSAHGHAADSVALTQAHVLGVADALHGHSADSVDLSLSVLLSVADALHSHGVDNVALTQAHVLAVADALHGHFAANVVLEHAMVLDVDGAIHGHSASGVQLSLADILAVASSIHEHTADEIELTQQHVLIVSDAVHAQIAELVDVRLPGLATSREVFMITAEDRIYLIAPETQRVVN